MYEKPGIYNCRMTSVIDCGTDKLWLKRVFLSFQIADFMIKPKDATLPSYAQFAKFPYGWDVCIDESSESRVKQLQPVLDAFWYEEWDVLDFLISKAGETIMLNIETNEYQWKKLPIVADWGHMQWMKVDMDWWVDVKTFKFTEYTTMSDLDELWFDKKQAKKWAEYKAIKENVNTDDLIQELF